MPTTIEETSRETREDIIAATLASDPAAKHYFEPYPCSNGHFSLRYIKGNRCLQCAQERKDEIRASKSPDQLEADRLARREYHRAWVFGRTGVEPQPQKRLTAEERKEKHREYSRNYLEHNRDKLRAYKKAYRKRKREEKCVERQALKAEQRHQKALEKVEQKRLDAERRALESMDHKTSPEVLEPRRQTEKARKQLWRQTKAGRDYKRFEKANKRARSLGAEGLYKADDIYGLYTAQNGICANPHCNARLPDGYQVDHIQPISRGGSNWPDNLQLLCPPCNLDKGTLTNEEWHLVLGYRQTNDAPAFVNRLMKPAIEYALVA